jgi:hypothetical protein
MVLDSSIAAGGAADLPPQHPDQHRPERPILLAVDQELCNSPVLLQDPVEVPVVWDPLQLMLSGILEPET